MCCSSIRKSRTKSSEGPDAKAASGLLLSLGFFVRRGHLSELELEGELDGTGAADLVEGVEARVIGTGQATG